MQARSGDMQAGPDLTKMCIGVEVVICSRMFGLQQPLMLGHTLGLLMGSLLRVSVGCKAC